MGPGGTRQATAARQQADLDIARAIAGEMPDQGERLQLWKERTGKSRAALYRWLAKLPA